MKYKAGDKVLVRYNNVWIKGVLKSDAEESTDKMLPDLKEGDDICFQYLGAYHAFTFVQYTNNFTRVKTKRDGEIGDLPCDRIAGFAERTVSIEEIVKAYGSPTGRYTEKDVLFGDLYGRGEARKKLVEQGYALTDIKEAWERYAKEYDRKSDEGENQPKFTGSHPSGWTVSGTGGTATAQKQERYFIATEEGNIGDIKVKAGDVLLASKVEEPESLGYTFTLRNTSSFGKLYHYVLSHHGYDTYRIGTWYFGILPEDFTPEGEPNKRGVWVNQQKAVKKHAKVWEQLKCLNSQIKAWTEELKEYRYVRIREINKVHSEDPFNVVGRVFRVLEEDSHNRACIQYRKERSVWIFIGTKCAYLRCNGWELMPEGLEPKEFNEELGYSDELVVKPEYRYFKCVITSNPSEYYNKVGRVYMVPTSNECCLFGISNFTDRLVTRRYVPVDGLAYFEEISPDEAEGLVFNDKGYTE